jgi:hypothetical protein
VVDALAGLSAGVEVVPDGDEWAVVGRRADAGGVGRRVEVGAPIAVGAVLLAAGVAVPAAAVGGVAAVGRRCERADGGG